MNKTKWSCALALAVLMGPYAPPARASVQDFVLDRGTVKLDVPSDWQDVSNLFGVPLMLVGPESGGGRPVVTVTATGRDGDAFSDEKALEKEQGEYREGRKEWVKNLNGKVVSFEPYRKIAWDGVSAAHTVGFRYKLGGIEFAESSYYVICKSKLYHLKTLLRAAHEDEFKQAVDKAVRSFTCE